MDNTLYVSAAPHIHSGASTNNIMRDVLIALAPATIVALVYFGWAALWIILACVGSAILSEFLFNLICKRKQTICDLSAAVTGLLLALNLSTNVPIWQCVIGSVFAIVVVKCLFGGLGKNVANPAIAGRVLLLISFSAVAGGANPTLFPEVTSSATPLVDLNNGVQSTSFFNLLFGIHGGAIGETCAIALLAGFVYLVVRKVIKWYVPFTFAFTVGACYFIYYITKGTDFINTLKISVAHVLAGGLLLGAIFMATDYVTTPVSNLGRVVFCIGCGLITFFIRQFGNYPEGVSISILAMNLLTPLIERFTTPKPLGGVR